MRADTRPVGAHRFGRTRIPFLRRHFADIKLVLATTEAVAEQVICPQNMIIDVLHINAGRVSPLVCLIVMAPSTTLVLLLRRFVVEALSAGAVKGRSVHCVINGGRMTHTLCPELAVTGGAAHSQACRLLKVDRQCFRCDRPSLVEAEFPSSMNVHYSELVGDA